MKLKRLFPHTVFLMVLAFFTVVALYVFKPSVTEIENIPASVITTATTTAPKIIAEIVPNTVPTPLPLSHYIEIIDGCGPYYNSGVCVNVREGAGIEFPVVARLRTGVVLRVQNKKYESTDGSLWYKVIQDQELRYPERVKGSWYVAVNPDAVRPFDNIGDERVPVGEKAATSKRIIVNLTEKMIYAYEGDELFMKAPVSPGLADTPTPRGYFNVFYKTPSRYMQGPIPGVSEQEYDLPGVSWNLYFSPEGAVIHGAYWHDNFGKKWSHGCVNMAPKIAEKLYNWADIGMSVRVKD